MKRNDQDAAHALLTAQRYLEWSVARDPREFTPAMVIWNYDDGEARVHVFPYTGTGWGAYKGPPKFTVKCSFKFDDGEEPEYETSEDLPIEDIGKIRLISLLYEVRTEARKRVVQRVLET